MKNKVSAGFTLVELMVVVAIIGILSGIAIPSYTNYVIKSARIAAQTELLQLATIQEKIYLNSNGYASSVSASYTGTVEGGLGNMDKSGVASSLTSDGKYTLSLVADSAGTAMPASSQTFVLRAIPVTGKAQAGNGCLTLSETGSKRWHENNDACNTASPAGW